MHREKIDSIDLLKMDIEGAEIEVFQSLSNKTLCSIKQLAVEFHDFLGLNIQADIAGIKKRLAVCGFMCLVFKDDSNVLFINMRKVHFKWRELVCILLLRLKQGLRSVIKHFKWNRNGEKYERSFNL